MPNWQGACAKALAELGKAEFCVDDFTDRLLPRLEIIHWTVGLRAVAHAALAARRMSLPDPEQDTLAARVADLSDADAMTEALLEQLMGGQLWLEDFRHEIAWSLALLECERRSALWMADPTAADAIEPLGAGFYRRPRRLAQGGLAA